MAIGFPNQESSARDGDCLSMGRPALAESSRAKRKHRNQSCRDSPHSQQLMIPYISSRREGDGHEGLAPKPPCRSAGVVLFDQISDQGLISLWDTKMLQQPARHQWRISLHKIPPNSGTSCHMLISA